MANKEYRELLQAISSLGENERITVSPMKGTITEVSDCSIIQT